MTDKRHQAQNFGQWLETAMANEGLTPTQLAQKAGIDDALISRWRRGRGKPSIDTAARLADALGVDRLRLAVTAGAISEDTAGVPPLPMPSTAALVERVRAALEALPGVAQEQIPAMLEAFERGIDKVGDGDIEG